MPDNVQEVLQAFARGELVVVTDDEDREGEGDLIVAAPWVAIAPGLALILTVLACTLIGDSLRDRLAGESGATLRDRV